MRRGTVTAFITTIFVLAMATTSTTGYSRGTARVIEPAASVVRAPVTVAAVSTGTRVR